MKQSILIAGCGDLGRRVAERLAQRGERVAALRRHPPAGAAGGASPAQPQPQWLQADLTRPDTLAELAGRCGGIDRVVYLPTPDARTESAYRAVFVDGLRNLLAATGPALNRIVFVSSTAVYGDHGGAWIDEDTPTDPPGMNGAVLCEASRLLAGQPIPAVELRLAGIYGPGRLQLAERLRAGLARAPAGEAHWANRIHADDAAAAIVHLLFLPDPQPLYLGADDTPLPLRDLYAGIARLAGAPPPAIGPAPAGIGSKRVSNARLKASGLALRWPDTLQGYAALLRDRGDGGQPSGVSS